MRWLFIMMLAVGCGATVQRKPSSAVESPKGMQYCTVAEVRFQKKIHQVYICTPDKKLCLQGVNKARGTGGKIVGIKSVADCKLVFH